MSWNAATFDAATNTASSGGSRLFEDGLGWGGVLLVVVMIVALAVVSGLGILARMRDRAAEQAALRASNPTADSDRALDQRSESSSGS